MVHQNICDHADDLRSLYKLWDDDLRLMMRKRQIAELIGSAAFAAVTMGMGDRDCAVPPEARHPLRGNLSITSGPAPDRSSKPDSDEAVAERLRLLRKVTAGSNQTEFAERLGISAQRWNNFERGNPLSKEIAILLVKRFPGITLDWLFLGNPNGLTLRRLRDLDIGL